jgi:hypothetical protein
LCSITQSWAQWWLNLHFMQTAAVPLKLEKWLWISSTCFIKWASNAKGIWSIHKMECSKVRCYTKQYKIRNFCRIILLWSLKSEKAFNLPVLYLTPSSKRSNFLVLQLYFHQYYRPKLEFLIYLWIIQFCNSSKSTYFSIKNR